MEQKTDLNGFWTRSNPDNTCITNSSGELCILRQEAVAWNNGIGVILLRYLENAFSVRVRCSISSWQQDRLVCLGDMERGDISGSVDGHSLDTKFLCGFDDSDLVGKEEISVAQHLSNHWRP